MVQGLGFGVEGLPGAHRPWSGRGSCRRPAASPPSPAYTIEGSSSVSNQTIATSNPEIVHIEPQNGLFLPPKEFKGEPWSGRGSCRRPAASPLSPAYAIAGSSSTFNPKLFIVANPKMNVFGLWVRGKDKMCSGSEEGSLQTLICWCSTQL